MANHWQHLMSAKAVSLLSDFERVHLGCVLVYNNRAISSGFNSVKSSPLQMKYNKYRKLHGQKIDHLLHSETMAVQRISHFDIDYSKTICYTYRQGKDGRPMMARPCPSCMRMLQDLGIKKICYSTESIEGYCIERI